jgi:hypothetical protein
LDAFRPWIDKKIEELTGVEDELITSFCISELEAADEKGPDPRKLHINLTGENLGYFTDQSFGVAIWWLNSGLKTANRL